MNRFGSPRLIAIMGDSYEKVKEHDKVEALHERAKMIVEMELQHPNWHTFCEFMHVVEAADEDSKPAQEWQGIIGRVKQLLEPLATHTKATNSKVQQLEQGIAEVRQEMAGRMDEMAGRMDEMRDLMQLLLDRRTDS